MASLKLPQAGLHIEHQQAPTSERRQVIYLDSKSHKSHDMREIFKAIKNNERVKLRLGPQPTIDAGKTSVNLQHAPTEFKLDLFISDRSGPAYFAGQLNDCLKALAPAEQALKTLKSNLNTVQVGNKDGITFKKDNRPSSSLLNRDRLMPTSTPGSPFVGARSPQHGPTSMPFAGGLTPQEKVKQEAIKKGLMHLLAIEPQPSSTIAAKVGIKQDECDKLLVRWAQDARKGPGKKELRDKLYKELDVWKFPFVTQADRQAAIDHAISAFDRQRIDKHDKIWQMLLAPQDRDKGIFLSRLNFDKPIPAGNLTPRVPERSTDGSTEGKSMTSELDDKNRKAKAEQAVKELLGGKKKRQEPEKKPLAEKSVVKPTAAKAGATTTKDFKKIAVQATKQPSKFKSNERIIDSDEEADDPTTITVAVADPQRKQHSVAPKSLQQTTKTTSASKPTTASTSASHKPQSSSSSVEIDRRLNATKMAKTRSGADTTKPKPLTARADSAAQKSSPFGSSPPTNSTDADATSSGKASSQSSAISSPPSSTELNEVRRNSKFSPSILAAKPTKPAQGGIKRKADTKHDETATKRQQVNGAYVNGLPKALGAAAEKRGRTLARDSPATEQRDRTARRSDSPASDALSSPERPAKVRKRVIESAREFLLCHSRYKALHESLAKKESAERSDEDMDQVWKMHQRLAGWKKDLWRDWEALENGSAR